MNKNELINAVAAKAEFSKKDAEAAVNAVFAAVTDALAAGDKLSVIGYGTFEVKERAAKSGRNPRTGEAITIAASKVPAFKAGKALKDAVTK
ncbi:MAG: HU family DNA-binding protein [Clostridia bacterium]|nr:HU family DNA-binding protein [Clostridia bacterium]